MQKKLKPFDLEAALNGAAVVTRSGKQVSELVYLKTIKHPTYRVIASIDGGLETYSEQGTYHNDMSSEHDLFMKPQQITKWINIYVTDTGTITTGKMFDTQQQAMNEHTYFGKPFSTTQITFEA